MRERSQQESRRTASSKAPYLAGLLGMLILMLPTVLNGSPTYFIDTQSYTRIAAVAGDFVFGTHVSEAWRRDRTGDPAQLQMQISNKKSLANNGVTASRSIYYGIILYASYLLGSFWAVVGFQCWIVATTLAILWFRFELGGYANFSISLAALCLISPVALFCGFIMPDIFAAIAILSGALLLTSWNRLSTFDIIFLWSAAALSVLVHNSHILIVVAMLGLALIVPSVRRSGNRYSAALTLGLLPVSLLGQFAFSTALYRATGAPPIVLPHISAHLVDRGPGTEWLAKHCGEHNFEICNFRDKLPIYWEDFLGNSDPKVGIFAASDVATRRLLSQEQTSFAIAVFKDEPLKLTKFLIGDGIGQLFQFGLPGFVAKDQFSYIQNNWPTALARPSASSLFYTHPCIIEFFSLFVYIFSAISFVIIIASCTPIADGWFELYDLRRFSAVVFWGVCANGLICGVLASPYDRFQARVIWLLPLVAGVFLISALRGRQRRPRK